MKRLLLPAAVLLTLGVADVYFGGELRRWSYLPSVSRLVSAVAFFLAWRLRRGRIAWAVAALWLVAEIPRLGLHLPGMDGDGLACLAFVASILLPLHLAAAAMISEFWLAGTPGALRFGILGAEVATGVVLAQPSYRSWVEALRHLEPGLARLAQDPATVGTLGGPPSAWSDHLTSPLSSISWLSIPLPTLSLAAYLVSAILVTVACFRRRTPLEAGLLGALAASFLAWVVEGGSGLYLVAAVSILGLALVEDAFRLAFLDGLTELPARRALEERVGQLGRTYALAMLDLDHFKKLNDKHGHEVGDQVLRLVSARLAQVTGNGEAFRYGGEEFTVVFPAKSAAEAKAHLETLRQSIAGHKFTVRSPGRPKSKPRGAKKASSTPRSSVVKQLRVTVSIGVAERNARATTPEQVLKAADKALYKAKRAGRNRIAVAR